MADATTVFLTRIVEAVILPPTGPLILIAAGIALFRWWRRIGGMIVILGWLSMYLASIPFTAALLNSWLEVYSPLTPQAMEEMENGVIVVLGGPDRYHDAPEYGSDMPGAKGLERLRYAAHLHRTTGLPLLAVGGKVVESNAIAELMVQGLVEDFQVPVKWIVAKSRNTFDNAKYAGELLLRERITEVYLVTHAWHMRRAKLAFEDQGLTVTPAPTAFTTPSIMDRGWFAWLPRGETLQRTNWALHEMAGMLWYWLFLKEIEETHALPIPQ